MKDFAAIMKALRAYDQPRKVYTMPPWWGLEYSVRKAIGAKVYDMMHGGRCDTDGIYNAIREALAKEETP